MQIAGKVALVTGGASGLGEATVRRLVKAGGRAVIVDMNVERGQALEQELGDAVAFARTDVADEAAVQAAIAIAGELGELRACVNCAGIGVPPGRTVGRDGEAYPLDQFIRCVTVNLVGTYNVTRLAAAAMAKLDPVDTDGLRGVVVNTASLAAFDGQTGQAPYSASKAGVAGMTLPLARDFSAIGVRVCCIAPGTFDTPIFDAPGVTDEMKQAFQAALLADNVFPRRLGDADEFAALVEHLISNDMLNGETIRIDAGTRLRPNPSR